MHRPAVKQTKRVKLMLTCLCDAFFGEVGIATVKVLEHVGVEVEFDSQQTCCGQPPFNAGDWAASRKVADYAIKLFFADERPVVTPSGSCAAMMREGYPLLYSEDSHRPAFEISEYLWHVLGIHSWPPSGTTEKDFSGRKIAFHRACHGRGIGIGESQEELVASIPGIDLISFGQQEQCCGFGGAFCATLGKVSAGIGLEKLKNIQDAGATEIVSGDMGCLMQLGGLIEKEGLNLKITHIAELLAEVIS
jgi:L-lactate dehydrogenase complex protein LldE